MDERIEGVVESLGELCEDTTIPKSLREKLKNIIENIKGENGELSIKIDRALHELESISDDSNLQSYTRTQLWNIVSMLEMAN